MHVKNLMILNKWNESYVNLFPGEMQDIYMIVVFLEKKPQNIIIKH